MVRPGSDAVVWDKYEGVAAAVQVGTYGFAHGIATLTLSAGAAKSHTS